MVTAEAIITKIIIANTITNINGSMLKIVKPVSENQSSLKKLSINSLLN